MLTIVYDPKNGRAVPDGNVDIIVEDILFIFDPNIDDAHIFSTENIIHAFRMSVKQGRIPIEHINFIFYKDDEEIPIAFDKHGRVRWWPRGFCDTVSKYHLQLL